MRGVAEATCLLLELEGYDVLVASSQSEALDRVAAASPDLIVSDFHFRGGDTGVAVVASVRRRIRDIIPVRDRRHGQGRARGLEDREPRCY